MYLRKCSDLVVVVDYYREGSVIVEFDLTHTYYLDETNPGEVVMRNTLQDELGKFQLGTYKATPDGFVFVAKEGRLLCIKVKLPVIEIHLMKSDCI